MESSAIEKEFGEIDGAFQVIKELSYQEATQRNFTYAESCKPANRRLNRYGDVHPYDHSRIVLKRGDTDYINANLVEMDRANRRYILTQGPLPHTVSHFWVMVWEQNSMAILMLNKLIEKKMVKCHMYWPEHTGADNQLDLADVGLTVEFVHSEEFTDYTKRLFRLSDKNSGKTRDILQFHYNTWPDFGIPSTSLSFLQFLKQVRDSGALSPEVGPAVVHCSAGIGRSGTFCLVDTCLVLVDKEGQKSLSVRELLLELRRYRLGLIQTYEQLYFSYKAIIEGIQHFNDPSFMLYEEVPKICYNPPGESVPPPIPPPRAGSLTTHSAPAAPHHQPNKKLPTIPFSTSANDLDLVNRNHTNQIDRPLPPLPTNCLDIINEPGTTDEDPLDDDHDDDDDDNDADEANNASSTSESNNENIDEEPSELDDDSDDESNDDNMIDEIVATNKRNNAATVDALPSARLTNGGGQEESFDADATLPPSPTERTQQTNGIGGSSKGNIDSNVEPPEVRRRKRVERQSVMEDRIREIKRKQRDAEDAPKKRRCNIKKQL